MGEMVDEGTELEEELTGDSVGGLVPGVFPWAVAKTPADKRSQSRPFGCLI